jgi:hypothetical protein
MGFQMPESNIVKVLARLISETDPDLDEYQKNRLSSKISRRSICHSVTQDGCKVLNIVDFVPNRGPGRALSQIRRFDISFGSFWTNVYLIRFVLAIYRRSGFNKCLHFRFKYLLKFIRWFIHVTSTNYLAMIASPKSMRDIVQVQSRCRQCGDGILPLLQTKRPLMTTIGLEDRSMQAFQCMW